MWTAGPLDSANSRKPSSDMVTSHGMTLAIPAIESARMMVVTLDEISVVAEHGIGMRRPELRHMLLRRSRLDLAPPAGPIASDGDFAGQTIE
ncbi:hypothetical protein TSAR_015693 [Trichomalopsis sarcophagae]|uniref:Uncharacterized protein n=1 Tax=Trichomalopsis sarcophagae TaxID=543379 RepID=A0A232FDL1_9HYME|nr:hypothetical protein TSAR_015693 [Trichomalopsis sarcophagae]